MVVRADVLATPALLFESDRKKIHLAIDQTQPGAAPLNLQEALDFAAQAQKVQAQRPGEIVFIGAGRIPSEQAARLNAPANFRLIADRRPYRARRIAKSQRASRHGRSRCLGSLHRREELRSGGPFRSHDCRLRRIARGNSPLRSEAGRRRRRDVSASKRAPPDGWKTRLARTGHFPPG